MQVKTKRVTRDFIRQLRRDLRKHIADSSRNVFLCERASAIDHENGCIEWNGSQRAALQSLLIQDGISLLGTFSSIGKDNTTPTCSNKARLAWLIKNEKRWLEASKSATI